MFILFFDHFYLYFLRHVSGQLALFSINEMKEHIIFLYFFIMVAHSSVTKARGPLYFAEFFLSTHFVKSRET